MNLYVLQIDFKGTDLKAGDLFTVLDGKVYFLVESIYEHEFLEQNPRLFKPKENENSNSSMRI